MRRRPVLVLLAFVATMATAACGGIQSALVPAGKDAELIAHLFHVMAVGAAIVWIAVVAVAVYATRTSRESHSHKEVNYLVVGGGVALPTVVLGALLFYGLPALPAMLAPAADH